MKAELKVRPVNLQRWFNQIGHLSVMARQMKGFRRHPRSARPPILEITGFSRKAAQLVIEPAPNSWDEDSASSLFSSGRVAMTMTCLNNAMMIMCRRAVALLPLPRPFI